MISGGQALLSSHSRFSLPVLVQVHPQEGLGEPRQPGLPDLLPDVFEQVPQVDGAGDGDAQVGQALGRVVLTESEGATKTLSSKIAVIN